MKKTALLIGILLLFGLSGCGAARKESTEAPQTREEPAKTTAEETAQPTTEAVPVAELLSARWISGNLSDLAGFYEPNAVPEKTGMLALLQPGTKVSLPEIPADAAFPLEVPLTVTTPDLAAILTDLHYENYEDSGKLSDDIQAVLNKGGYPERTVTVTVTLEKEGDDVHAQQNNEAFFAFYGGLAELYMQEYEKYLEELGNELGGQKP